LTACIEPASLKSDAAHTVALTEFGGKGNPAAAQRERETRKTRNGDSSKSAAEALCGGSWESPGIAGATN